jgi:hypothetical protein
MNVHRYDHLQVLEGEDRHDLEVNELVREIGMMPGRGLAGRLRAILDAPLEPRDRQRLVRAVDALVVRVDAMAGIAEAGAV